MLKKFFFNDKDIKQIAQYSNRCKGYETTSETEKLNNEMLFSLVYLMAYQPLMGHLMPKFVNVLL